MGDLFRVTIESTVGEDEDYRRSVVTEETDELGWSMLWALERQVDVGRLNNFVAELIDRHAEYSGSDWDGYNKDETRELVEKEQAFIKAAHEYRRAVDDYDLGIKSQACLIRSLVTEAK